MWHAGVVIGPHLTFGHFCQRWGHFVYDLGAIPRRLVVVLAIVLVAAIAGVVLVTALVGHHTAHPVTPSPSPSAGTSVAPRAGGVTTTDRGPVPPAHGAWFGAFIQTADPTVSRRQQATAEFQQQIGSTLTIVHTFHPWDEAFPSPYDRSVVKSGKLLMISWGGTDTRSIALGRYDDLIRQRAAAIRGLGVPILLRFRWEMDRPNLQASIHSPADYIAAWKHVRKIFTDIGATNAGWVWCPLATGFATGRAQPYYPGDDEVDWIGADAYPGPRFLSFAQLMTPVLAFAREHPRPVLVGEFGIKDKVPSGQRAAWLRGMQTYVSQQPQLKALVYFLARKTTQTGGGYNYTFASGSDSLAALRSALRSAALSARAPDISPSPTGSPR